MNNETDEYGRLLDGHIRQIIKGFGCFTGEHWDWKPTPASPSAHQLADHIYNWLVADRNHIMVPDALFHDDIPPAPQDQQGMIAALEEERKEWDRTLGRLRAEDLDAPRRQFNRHGVDSQDVRWIILDALQHITYDNGQLVELFYIISPNLPAYSATLPQAYYEQLRKGWREHDQ